MIVFDLECQMGDHRFEGWFGSSDDFAAQQQGGLLSCPLCGSAEVMKAPMAPNVPRKSNAISKPAAEPTQAVQGGALPPEAAKMMQAMAAMQAEALKNSQWVGDKFTEQSRAMHYGESAAKPIHGQATVAEAKALLDEGIAVAPLPFPLAPPDEIN